MPAVSRLLALLLRGLAFCGRCLAEAFDLVLPRTCPCGEADGTVLCAACAETLAVEPLRVEAACPALQLVSEADAAVGTGSLVFEPVLPVLALGEHAGRLRRVLLAWKNGGMLCLSAPLAAALAPGVPRLVDQARGSGATVAPTDVHLVPVPSSLAHRARRGEHHTGELARGIARRTGARTADVLRLRGSGSQLGRGRRERREGRWNRVQLRRAHSAVRRAVLVDDVVTTGSTLRSAHDALEAAGIEVLGALVVASARMPRAAPIPSTPTPTTPTPTTPTPTPPTPTPPMPGLRI